MSLLDRLSNYTMGRRPDTPVAPPPIDAPILQVGHFKSIIDAHDRQIITRRVGDGHADRFADYTHVSSLVDICTRQSALGAGDDRLHYERVTGGHRVMWAFGRAVEHHIRTSYLTVTQRRQAWGVWKCVCGDTEHTGFAPAGLCQRCGHPAHQYNELTLFDHERKLKGNPDMIAVPEEGWYVPIEIKSMNKGDWDALERPLGNHITQVGIYHRMMIESGYRVLPIAVIIYASKDFSFGSPYKEYHVDMNSSTNRDIVTTAMVAAEEIALSRATGHLPPRRCCTSHTDTRAKSCPFVVGCFNRD